MAALAGVDRSWWLPQLGEQVVALCPNGDSALGIVLPGNLYQDRFAVLGGTAHQAGVGGCGVWRRHQPHL
ncbi:phage baseplate assembly protein V [Xylella taiwanensis]|uniref:Phage baseplate assembly protein V n=1 Tax=Xylella taiwanensis TaxID=1444770 RepID=A0ABS8TWT0_9GAMM|nr:phage baseplate assembly protein V [Xylella taiwanensis]MCD8456178.1 phage baseplate assembly protein V [Xylella taiwanensis]MCD8458586.1 phage baseplate assembly protein V [Xylella taiwanensis]MCD8460720.1 phage baseplate assembly protein V [Xylella taiwanensis]MCD8465225.1 phage baseplate assembly protein V [Xylella taiwanensis]MCD8470448.1 phage baseplate assembly protein V [Xylella taiwanensis]